VARLRVLRAVSLAAAAAVLAAGCATVPTVGQPRAVTGATGQVPQFVQPIPPVPQPSWTPTQVVQGFLAASASFTDNHAAAQKFLSPSARRTFQLSRWTVRVVSGQPDVSTPPLVGPVGKQEPGPAEATVATQQVATISPTGQYVYGRARVNYSFTLVMSGGQWRINNLSQPALLLSQDSFKDVYQPRNLYFLSPGDLSTVPEPVFAPQQDNDAAAAASLVHALLRTNLDRGPGQQGQTWLAGAALTAFPPGTTLIGNKVAIAGQTATVNLGGAAARASNAKLQLMAQQLVTTLTSTSYSSPAIARHVVLKVNGQVRDSNEPPSPPALAPSGGPLYYLAPDLSVSSPNGKKGKVIRNPVGPGQIPFTEIAVLSEPPNDTQLLAGAAPSGQGCAVYHGPLAGSGPLTESVVPAARSGACTSVSWDSQGDIWAVAGGGIWVLQPGESRFAAVPLPPLPGGSKAGGYHVLSVRVAGDAVRVAMLVQVAGATQVVMAAASHTHGGIVLGPTVAVGPVQGDSVALDWLDADHLVVLAGSELYTVPVNGGSPAPLESAPPLTAAQAGPDSVTVTGAGHIALSALSGAGPIWTSSGPDQPPQRVPGGGTSAVYRQ
jgi:hypothetical protein